MRLLVDNALSPKVSRLLQLAGHDAIHLRDLGMQAATDSEVFRTAEDQNRTIVSADTDFGALLAVRRKSHPSFILFRKATGMKPNEIASNLLRILQNHEEEIIAGCIVSIRDESIRIRVVL